MSPGEAKRVLILPATYVFEDSSGWERIRRSVCSRGIITPVLVVPAREEEGKLYVVDGVDRVRAAIDCGRPIPILVISNRPLSADEVQILRYVVNRIRKGVDEGLLNERAEIAAAIAVLMGLNCDALRDLITGNVRTEVVNELATHLGLTRDEAFSLANRVVSKAGDVLTERFEKKCEAAEHQTKATEESEAGSEKEGQEVREVAVPVVEQAFKPVEETKPSVAAVEPPRAPVQVGATETETQVVSEASPQRSASVISGEVVEVVRCGDNVIPSDLFDQAMSDLARIHASVAKAFRDACREGRVHLGLVKQILSSDNPVDKVAAVFKYMPHTTVYEKVPISMIVTATLVHRVARMTIPDAVLLVSLVGSFVVQKFLEARALDELAKLFALLNTPGRDTEAAEVITRVLGSLQGQTT